MGKIGTSKRHWFGRGMAAGFMLLAGINAASWFYLSDGWTDLCGATLHNDIEAIGFPFEIWRENKTWNGTWLINYISLGLNLLVGLAVGIVGGFIAASMSDRFNPLVTQFETEQKEVRPFPFTFSVRGLFIATTIAAIVLGVSRSLGPTSWLLGVIYFAGPLALILIAMAPVGLQWEQRVFILVPFAILMLVGSVVIGTGLGMQFDRVLFGIFICWVPQSIFAAAIILVFSIWSASKAAMPARTASE